MTRSPILHVAIGDGAGSGGGGDRVTLVPDPAVAGQSAEVAYDPQGGPLDGTSAVALHYGFDDWTNGAPADVPMTWDSSAASWEATVTLPGDAYQLDLAFHDGAGTWDNNNGADWHFDVTGGATGWVMDGELDAGARVIGTKNGVTLWVGCLGDELYVATQPAGAGADRFLLIAEAAGPMVPAMWGKSGEVAAWDAFLAMEAENGWSGWFDAAGDTRLAAGSVLEGTLRLTQEFGALPRTVTLALALYASPDGGALDPTRQLPPTADGDDDLQASEYAVLPTRVRVR
ncbi:MAG: carbohydrate-binding protein [Planctomycetota bacterium]|nr:carbohydrate-binding protein [Planctomycetota bacterium]